MLPLGSRPGPWAVTLLASPWDLSTYTSKGLLAMCWPAKSTVTCSQEGRTVRAGLGHPRHCPPLGLRAHLMSPRHLGDIPDREGTVLVVIGGHLCLGWEGVREPLLRAAPPRGGPAAPCPACWPPYLLLVPGRILHVHQHLSLPGASGLHSELCPLLHHVACGLDACPGMGGKPQAGCEGWRTPTAAPSGCSERGESVQCTPQRAEPGLRPQLRSCRGTGLGLFSRTLA